MPDMLVLKRDRRSGELVMLVEIDPAPVAPWIPGPAPEPNVHRDRDTWTRDSSNLDDLDWCIGAVADYVDSMEIYPLEITGVNWAGLRRDLAGYVISSR